MSEVDGDTTICCTDCRIDFVFTSREADFLAQTFGEGFKPPKRCKTCRAKRRMDGPGRYDRGDR